MKSNAELLKILKDLHAMIKDATMSVQRAAHEVRVYPVEAVTQATVRIEQSIKTCENSATEAQEVYSEAKQLISKLETNYIWWIIAAALISAMAVATPVLLILRSLLRKTHILQEFDRVFFHRLGDLAKLHNIQTSLSALILGDKGLGLAQ